MILNCKQHRENEKSDFLYKNPEKIDVTKVQQAFEQDFFKNADLPKPDMSREEVLEWVKQTFEQKFSPEKYEEELRVYISNRVTNSNETDRLLRDAVNIYKREYTAAMAIFYRKAEDKMADYEETEEIIKNTTKEGLKKLSQAVGNIINAESATPTVDNVTPPARKEGKWAYEIPILGPLFKNVDIPIISFVIDSKEYREYKAFQREAYEKFGEFNSALSKKYLNLEWQKLNGNLTDAEYKRYKDLAENFDDGMKNHINNQLGFIFENINDKDTLRQRLEELRDGILKTYKEQSGDDGLFDLAELGRMEAQSKGYIEILKLINSNAGDEEIARKFESSQYFNRDSWKKAVEAVAEQLIKDSTANGSEAALIDLVKKWTDSKKDMNFNEAASEFKDIMEKHAETGVKETLHAVREFNNAVNGERVGILKLDDIKPSLKGIVYRERELLLERITIPKNIDDRLIVEFMITDLDGRNRILNDTTLRLALFQAIQNIKKHYSAKYRKEYHRSIPRDVTKMTSSSNPDEPTRYDNMARLVAVLTLANEAEWVVKNLSQSADYRGRNFDKELESSEAEKVPPRIDTKFRDPNKLHRIGYITAAARGGFNGKDLGLSALKTVMGITVFMNFMNTWSKAEKGHKLEDIGKLAINPYMVAGVGAVYGIGRVQKNPDAMGYFSEDEGGKERIAVHLGLTKISEKTGNVRVFNFIGNSDEFRAMSELMKEPQQGVRKIKKLIEKAKKRKTEKPIITKEDLKDILEPAIWSQLPNNGDDRIRYLFYEKYLMTARNIRELRANCLKWK